MIQFVEFTAIAFVENSLVLLAVPATLRLMTQVHQGSVRVFPCTWRLTQTGKCMARLWYPPQERKLEKEKEKENVPPVTN